MLQFRAIVVFCNKWKS